jgi:phosphatidylethanolamine/phosphatidyl-N-methylethanolamine N-methyltransferase
LTPSDPGSDRGHEDFMIGFFREFLRDFHHTGAVLPSGRFLARAMARGLAAPGRPPWRVLEAGPGSGSVTRAIAQAMRPGDRLDLVEINPRFAEMVRARIAADASFAPVRDSIRVIVSPVQELPGESEYDAVVSGLPLNNFAEDEIRSIFAAFARLLKPGAPLVYFEYALVRKLKSPFTARPERERLARIDKVLGEYIARHQTACETVLVNVPPALVRTLRLKPEAHS